MARLKLCNSRPTADAGIYPDCNCDIGRWHQGATLNSFYRGLESRLRNIPGVSAFALSDTVPPAGGMHERPYATMRIAGHAPLPEEGGIVAFRYVSPGYFSALGVPIIAGRDFDEADRASGQERVILSESLARKMFGNENPIGQQIGNTGPDAHWSLVVGVAADVKNSGLMTAPDPEYYRVRCWNSTQLGSGAVAIFRTPLPFESLAPWIRREIAALIRHCQ